MHTLFAYKQKHVHIYEYTYAHIHNVVTSFRLPGKERRLYKDKMCDIYTQTQAKLEA